MDGGVDAAVDASFDSASPTLDSGSPAMCSTLPTSGNALALAFTTLAGGPAFEPTHVLAQWLPASCDTAEPEIVIALGDGCDPRAGSRLAFRVQRSAIQRGELPAGFPTFVENPHAYTVRLVLPPSLGPEPSIWGDCVGATGSITFDDIGWSVGSRQSASFDITLTDCAASPALPNVRASGSFSVTLNESFEDVCTR